jgi:hypothetical protein
MTDQAGEMADPSDAVSLQVDLSDLALPDHNGELWRTSDHDDRPVLLLFHRHLM